MFTLKNTMRALAAVMLVGSLSACSSDDETNDDSQFSISIAKQADYKITSGGKTIARSALFGGVLSAGNNAVSYFKKADCPDLYKQDFPDQVIHKEECQHVYQCIKEDSKSQLEGNGAIYEIDPSTFTAKEFYIVNVYSSKDHENIFGKKPDVAGKMHDLGINGVYIKEFNTNTCVAADLLITKDGLLDVTYDDSFGQKKQYDTRSKWRIYNIPGYGYYVGMDYGTTKFGDHPGDDDYSDWVIKLIPATKHEDPINKTNGEVEVNLSANDPHTTGDFIATKLSIHIRALTDAEIFVPVDKRYYCEADDMDISISHKDNKVIYNTDPKIVTMNIGGNKVTFTVAYEDEGIRITTDGINQQVIGYCASEYADGITFEVWNYFKDITRNDLKPMLDKTTVTFLDNQPKLYINAFAKENNYETLDYSGPIYSKMNDEGQFVPYTDEACTKPLDQKYWTRTTPDSKDYIFLGIPNPWDCIVTPTEPSYQPSTPDQTDPTLPNYNVNYTLK